MLKYKFNCISPENRLNKIDNSIAKTNGHLAYLKEELVLDPRAVEIVRLAKRDNDTSILPVGYSPREKMKELTEMFANGLSEKDYQETLELFNYPGNKEEINKLDPYQDINLKNFFNLPTEEKVSYIQKFKKFGKKAVPVAIAGVIGASILATGVAAEDVKISYGDKAYLGWWGITNNLIEIDKVLLKSALQSGNMEDIHESSCDLEQDAGRALSDLKSYEDEVSPELEPVIDRAEWRYKYLERAGLYCRLGAELESKPHFDACNKDMATALEYREESVELLLDYGEKMSKKSTQTKKPKPAPGEFVATKNGVDVTYESFDEPVQLYSRQNGEYYTFAAPGTDGWKWARKNLKVQIKDPAIGGTYNTYGEVCEALEKVKKESGKYNIEKSFTFNEDLSYYIDHMVIECKREKKTTQTKKENQEEWEEKLIKHGEILNKGMGVGHTKTSDTAKAPVKDIYSGFYGDDSAPESIPRYIQEETTQTKKPTPKPTPTQKTTRYINGMEVDEFGVPVHLEDFVRSHRPEGYVPAKSPTPSPPGFEVPAALGGFGLAKYLARKLKKKR